MTALENAKKMDELGGCTMMSAPTPSARVRQSVNAPDVSPAINRTRNTCRASAATLSAERNGRTPRLLHSRCQITNPLYGFSSICKIPRDVPRVANLTPRSK